MSYFNFKVSSFLPENSKPLRIKQEGVDPLCDYRNIKWITPPEGFKKYTIKKKVIGIKENKKFGIQDIIIDKEKFTKDKYTMRERIKTDGYKIVHTGNCKLYFTYFCMKDNNVK